MPNQASNVRELSREPRYIDPKATAETQFEQLKAFINNPPQNSRSLTITPALAGKIIAELNSKNRKKKPKKIKQWADAMTDRKWLLTGVPIIFARSGSLLDGQNRLYACVRSGVPFVTHVVFGITDAAFAVIDTNSVRTNKDAAVIDGMSYPEISAAAVRWLMIYDRDPLDRSLSFTNVELLDYYHSAIDKDVFERSVQRAVKVRKILPTGSLAAHFYMFEKRNMRVTAKFAADLADNVRGGLKLMAKLKTLRGQRMGRLHEVEINALLILAWNAYRRGETVTADTLKWDENKDFPSFD